MVELADLLTNVDFYERQRAYIVPDALERAISAGAKPPLTYVGSGATANVFCDRRGRAYKVAKSAHSRAMLKDEAAWLRSARRSKKLRAMIPRVFAFDPKRGVIVRDCVTGILGFGKHPKTGEWLEELAQKRFLAMEPIMLRKGWTVPETKPESWMFDPRSPKRAKLIDAGFVYPVGRRLVAHALELLKRGGTREDLDDAMRSIRNEALHWKSPTISKPKARLLLARLAAAGGSPDLAREVNRGRRRRRNARPIDEDALTLTRRPRGYVRELAGWRLERMRARREAFGGLDPKKIRGLELRSVSHPLLTAIITRSARGDTAWRGVVHPWQVTSFFKGEPTGHENAKTIEEAIEEAHRYLGAFTRVRHANPRRRSVRRRRNSDEGIRGLMRAARQGDQRAALAFANEMIRRPSLEGYEAIYQMILSFGRRDKLGRLRFYRNTEDVRQRLSSAMVKVYAGVTGLDWTRQAHPAPRESFHGV